VIVSDWSFVGFSLCSGAEFLFLVVHEAIPVVDFRCVCTSSRTHCHVLDYLHKKLDEMCLVQGGEVVTNFLCCTLYIF